MLKKVEASTPRRGLVPFFTGGLLLSIDPGKDTGWALFHPRHVVLVACGSGQPPLDIELSRVVVEVPQVYPTSPVPSNDLITLSLQAGRYIGEAPKYADVFTLWPHDWKGNLAKDVCAARVKSRLVVSELLMLKDVEDIVPEKQRHNVYDAIGIGLVVFRNIRL